jgi:hypothetical protein
MAESSARTRQILAAGVGRPEVWRMGLRQVKFPAAIETDFVGAMLNREHAAQVTVTASENELKYGQQFHKSWTR